MLRIDNLHVAVNGHEILRDVNLHVPKGKVHVLFGPNGSGKTTLMMTIAGFPQYKVTQGNIIFDGHDLLELDITERARLGIGISQQRPPTIKGVKLKAVVELLAQANDSRRSHIEDLLEKFNMNGFLDRDINSGLSGGEIKRSELFQLAATKPKFMMLDEPDSGIDLEQLKVIGRMINETLRPKHSEHDMDRKAGLLITHGGHILDYVYADRAHVFMDKTVKCSGNPRIMLDTVREHGYAECVSCMRQLVDLEIGGKADGNTAQ